MEDRDIIDPAIRSDPVTASPAAPSFDGRHHSTIMDSTLIHAGADQPLRECDSRTRTAGESSASEASDSLLVQGARAPQLASTTSAVLHGAAPTQSAAAAASTTLASALRPSAAAPTTSGTCARVLRARKAPAAAELAPSSVTDGATSSSYLAYSVM